MHENICYVDIQLVAESVVETVVHARGIMQKHSRMKPFLSHCFGH